MKLPLFLALFCALHQSVRADWLITEKTTSGDSSKPMVIKIKDDMVRNDMGTKMTVIIKGKDGVEMYMHDQKKIIRMTNNAMQGVSSLASKFLGGDNGKAAKPEPTGEKVKVGEWDTEVYTWKSKIGAAKYYIAKDFPGYKELNETMDRIAKSTSNPMTAMYPNAADFPGMVVKTDMTVMGKATTTELVSVKEGPLSADEFKGPEGYTEMKMPSLPKGLNPGAK